MIFSFFFSLSLGVAIDSLNDLVAVYGENEVTSTFLDRIGDNNDELEILMVYANGHLTFGFLVELNGAREPVIIFRVDIQNEALTNYILYGTDVTEGRFTCFDPRK